LYSINITQGEELASIETVYRRTYKGLSVRIYGGIKKRSRRNGWSVPFTKQEFDTWLFAQPEYLVLHTQWVDYCYYKWLVPSVNRIDSTKGYTLDNIQLMTWKENSDKGRTENRGCHWNNGILLPNTRHP